MNYSTSNKEIGDFGWLQTHSGLKVYPLAMKLEDINISDIAWALSNICRFNGHCTTFYSVASHSIIVARIIYNATTDKHLALWGLLHDASEAYLGDIVRPLKHLPEFGFYREKEVVLQNTILDRFGIYNEYPADWNEPDIIKNTDRFMIYLENEHIRSPLHHDNAFMPGNPEYLELIEKLKIGKEVNQYFFELLGKDCKTIYQIFLYDFAMYNRE